MRTDWKTVCSDDGRLPRCPQTPIALGIAHRVRLKCHNDQESIDSRDRQSARRIDCYSEHMARYRFITESGICCEVMSPKQSLMETAMVLLGFPATIGESALTNFLQELGFVVVQPQYPGTYDSSGVFTPDSATSSVTDVVRGLGRGFVTNLKRLDKQAIPALTSVCVGYSFGAHIALHALAGLPDVRHLVLLAPAVTYGDSATGFDSEDLSFMEYVSRSRPHTYRLGNMDRWSELFSGRRNGFPSASGGNLQSVHAFVGDLDGSIVASRLAVGLPQVMESIAPGVETTVHVVEGAGHSSSQLLNADTRTRIRELIAGRQ